MELKKLYETAELEIVKLCGPDIITTSIPDDPQKDSMDYVDPNPGSWD
jgi:hypothetical protein